MNMSGIILKSLIYILTYWMLFFSAVYLILIILKSILRDKIKISFRIMHISYISSLVVFIFLSIFAQYKIWEQSPFTKILNNLPVKDSTPLPGVMIIFKPIFMSKHGYLIHYSFTHFISNIIFGLGLSSLLYIVLKYISKFRSYLLDKDEVNVIMAGSLTFLWPHGVGYIVALFVVFVLHNIFNSIRGKSRTVILPSAICALILMFIFTNYFSESHILFKSLYFTAPL